MCGWAQGKARRRECGLPVRGIAARMGRGLGDYFAGPYSPWQRGSNDNTTGLPREYLPKGTGLSAWTPAQLHAIATEPNDRPRKRLGYHTPREAFTKLLTGDQRVATTP